MKPRASQRWAEQEFGGACLNDKRNVRRAVAIVAAVAERPKALVSEVFDQEKDQQGAYDFLQNPNVSVRELIAASARAAAFRARGERCVVVPVDGTSLTLRDPYDRRGTGRVGSLRDGARGLNVMDAIALTESGVPLGFAGMALWARDATPKKRSHKRVPPEQRETRYWNEIRALVREQFAAVNPDTTLWFVHDRGADAWPVLMDVFEQREGEFTTIRAAWDRRAYEGHDEDDARRTSQYDKLREVLHASPLKGEFALKVSAGDAREARTAKIAVQACAITLDLLLVPKSTHEQVRLWAVRICEVATTPRGEQPIEWLLLTSYPVRTFRDARRVVDGYALRWRIEEFHRIWKRGGSDIERTQLHDRDHIERWAVVHAAVAARIVRITHLARECPDEPASSEFDAHEIEAVRLLNRGSKPISRTPTMAEFIGLLAGIAGSFRYDGTPPGPAVLSRALERVAIAAHTLRARDSPRRRK